MKTLPGFWLALLAALALAVPAGAQTVERISVHGVSLEGNLEGNSADRTVFVVLPPSYARSPGRRYPVLYFLHGYTRTAENFMQSAAILAGATAAQANGGREMIVVVPDAYTRHGGSMFANSPTVGDFETFIARDLVTHIDAHYRTLARRESRGLGGHSMGGHGTLRLGMKHPEVFSSLYAMSACCIRSPIRSAEDAAAIDRLSPEEAATAGFAVRSMLALGAAWSPAPDRPPFFLDSGARDGAIDPLVAARWAANSPLAMLPQYLPALRRMNAIMLDAGNTDYMLADDRAVHRELERFGIAHRWQVYEGDHGNRVAERFRTVVLPFFQQHLAGR